MQNEKDPPRKIREAALAQAVALAVVATMFAAATIGCGAQDSGPQEAQALSDASVEEVSPFEGLVFYCTRCKKEVPETMGAGTSCPHCGAYFNSATNADGSNVEVDPPSAGIPVRYWGPVVLILMFGGEYLFRRWRKRRLTDD